MWAPGPPKSTGAGRPCRERRGVAPSPRRWNMADEQPKFSLVDLILDATKQTKQEAEAARPTPAKPPKEPDIELAPKRWAMDPDVRQEVHGLREGGRFEMSDCGEELDGVWRVVQLNLADPSPLERH